MRSITIFVAGVPSNTNRGGHAARARWAEINERKQFREAWRLAGLEVRRRWKPADRTRLSARQIQVQRYINIRRDPLGLAERLKGPVDGLVDAGLLPDDDEKHIEVVLARAAVGPVAGIEIRLEAT